MAHRAKARRINCFERRAALGAAFERDETSRHLRQNEIGQRDGSRVNEMALSPWAIDEATDLLYAHGARPSECFWLAADNINALFWGLHDWAHFHNHGPFVERAWTELQCDVSALAWLWINRRDAELDDCVWDRMRSRAADLSRLRFTAEGLAFDADMLAPGRFASL